MFSKIDGAARILLGAIFLIFGANGIGMLVGKPFIPMPPPGPTMKIFMEGLMVSGYLMPLVKGLEVLGGILLLSNAYVNLGIVLLAPVIVNIVGVHIFIDPSGLPMAVILGAGLGILIAGRWSDFKVLLKR